MKKLLTMLLVLTISLGVMAIMPGCGENNKDTDISVGILQVATHTALDNARKGFKDTLDNWATENGKTISYKECNANGNKNNEVTLADSLYVENHDILLGVSTSSAKALSNVTEDIPVLYTAVTDPVKENLTAKNVTGTNDMNPVSEQIAFIKDLVPNCKKIAFLFNSSEGNSVTQYDIAEAKCNELSIKLEKVTASKMSNIQTVVEGIANDVDAVYIPTDNLMASNMSLICSSLHPRGIPVVAGESGMCENGEGVGTLGVDYYKLGVQTAKMAIKILEGKKPSEIPSEGYSEKPSFYLNDENALSAGVSQDIINSIKEKYSK